MTELKPCGLPEILKRHPAPWSASMDGVKDANGVWVFKGTGGLDTLITELANFAAENTRANDGLVEALEYARPLVDKWCHYQANNEEFREEILAPIDAALSRAKGETE
jgi:hypothetical protein